MSEQEQLADAVAEGLGDAYLCTRVWQAWMYNTMTQDDFVLAGEDPDFVHDLGEAILASPWLAARDARIRAETLRAAAGMYPWLTRDLVSRASVKRWLMDRAKEETE